MARSKSIDGRTLCRTPTPGKVPVSIATTKYDAVAGAILSIVPAKPPGLAFKDLAAMVEARLGVAACREIGSVAWYVTTVKLELEVRGQIKRLAGSPQRLIRS